MAQRERIGVLVLRLGLGVFLLLWNCDKFGVSGRSRDRDPVKDAEDSDGRFRFNVGGIEALISLLTIAGAWRSYTYAAGLTLHGISTLASWRQLISPFGQGHHLFLAAIPVPTAFVNALHLAESRHVVGFR